jgi:hypothetical protein
MKFSLSEKDEERFWSKVIIKGIDDCWEWIGPFKEEYGCFGYEGRVVRAHVLSFKLSIQSFDSTLLVCHKCDHPWCVNPTHLFQGTHEDNGQDMSRKGRSSGFTEYKKVINMETGYIYSSVYNASDITGINRSEIIRSCKTGDPILRDYPEKDIYFRYEDE